MKKALYKVWGTKKKKVFKVQWLKHKMHAKIRMCNTNTNSNTEHNSKTRLISLTHTYIHTYIKVVGGALFRACLV